MRPRRSDSVGRRASPRRVRRADFGAERLEPRTLLSTLLPIDSPRDLVFDPVRGVLYATSFRDVARYDVNAGQLLEPWHVGLSVLNGLDVTADGGALYVADAGYNSSNLPGVRKVNTSSGAVTNLDYTPGFREGNPWDVAVADNGKVFFTTQSTDGSGFNVPLHQVDVTTGTISTRAFPAINNGTLPFSDMLLARGGDRGAVLMHDAGRNTLTVYEAAADGFPQKVAPAAPLRAPAAVSHDSSLVAVRLNSPGGSLDGAAGTYVFDRQLNFLRLLRGIDGGMAFDPAADVFYGVDSSTDEVVAFDTTTWRRKYALPVGEDVQPSQPMGRGAAAVGVRADRAASFFLATSAALLQIDLPRPTGDAAWVELSGFPSVLRAGVTHPLSVTVRDPAGEPATDYRGTVHFSATDLLPGLPADYTFTAADEGVHTFPVTLNTAGVAALTVADVADPTLTATQGSITVHGGTPPVVPLADPRALVYDDARGVLYVTTHRGLLERYDVATQSLLAPLRVGDWLNGADITPDGSALYVAEGRYAPNQLLVHRVDLADGGVKDYRYRHERSDGGAGDVVVLANGRALISPGFPQALEPVLELDPASGAFAPQYVDAINRYAVPYSSRLDRGVDRARALLQHTDVLTGPVALFSAAADRFTTRGNGGYSADVPGAVSRDSALMAVRLEKGRYLAEGAGVFDAQLNYVRVLPGIDGGMAFDAKRDVFYGVNSFTDELIAFDTRTWEEKYRLPLGLDVSPAGPTVPGTTAVSGDGRLLFLATPAGVRVIDLPQPTAQAATLRLGGFPSLVKAGEAARFTLTALDPARDRATGYRGTVRFSGSDVAAGLPAEYTFTAADAGSHEFTARLRTPGTQSLSAVDVATGSLGASQAGISVHGGDPWLLPIPGARDLVFDDANDRLLVATAAGNVEAYDLATQSMRAPLRVGSLLTGIDVTADGSTVYAADGLTGPLQGVFDKVRMADGSVTPVRYATPFAGPGPARDVVIAANGVALTTRDRSPSFGVIDPLTDTYAYSPGADGASVVSRGADRRTVLLQTDAGVFLYDADSGTVVRTRSFFGNFTVGFAGAAVNADGTLMAVVSGASPGRPTGATVLDRQLQVVKSLPGLDGGLAFDRSRALLYGVDSAANALVAYDTVTWQEKSRRPIGEDLGAAGWLDAPPWAGGLATSDDGRWLFLITPSGVRVFGVPNLAGVVGRHLFYNDSAFDGRNPAANAADDGAIAPATTALLPGQPAGAANVSGYSRGINGVMIDLFGYQGPGGLGAVGAAGDFELAVGTVASPSAWSAAPAPARVTVRKGAGVNGSDRLTFTWPDDAIRNTWLRVTVRPTAATGLVSPDVFYFGGLAGDTGNAPRGGAAVVDASDYVATRGAVSNKPAGITSRFDINHDGRVDVRDMADVRRGLGRSLPLWTPAPVAAQSAPVTRSLTRPITRGLFGTAPILG
jgi:DNA-binding beta-propeller fold protein YncE